MLLFLLLYNVSSFSFSLVDRCPQLAYCIVGKYIKTEIKFTL